MEQEALLLLGSNEGDRHENLLKARGAIRALPAELMKVSSIYETAAWGITEQENFLNQALRIKCELQPEFLMERLLDIEKQLGRQRTIRWGKRIIDIDILFIGDRIIRQERLTVPHPRLTERRFALVPLAEIEGEFVHPILQKNVFTLLQECPDNLPVTKL